MQALRDAGFDDPQIHAITTFVALRLAFATVNDALGTRPDHTLAERVPLAVREAVTFGRPVAAKADRDIDVVVVRPAEIDEDV